MLTALAGLFFTRWFGLETAGRSLAVWTLAGGAATAVPVRFCGGLFCRPDGQPLSRPGLANALTLVRLVWIAPTCYLLATGWYAAALGAYVLLGATDILDGIVARVRREISKFGVVMDPLADVLSTFAVFTVFVVDNLIPLWLYLLLAARYAMLLIGSLVLSAVAGPITYRATIPGKVVGVVQALGVVILMVGAARGGLAPDAPGEAVLLEICTSQKLFRVLILAPIAVGAPTINFRN
jgi:cardiolipin synthase